MKIIFPFLPTVIGLEIPDELAWFTIAFLKYDKNKLRRGSHPCLKKIILSFYYILHLYFLAFFPQLLAVFVAQFV